MKRFTLLCQFKKNRQQSIRVEDKFYLQFENEKVVVSRNSGPLEFRMEKSEDGQEYAVILRVKKSLKDLYLGNHPLKRDSVHFLEEDDTIFCQNFSLTLTSKEISQDIVIERESEISTSEEDVVTRTSIAIGDLLNELNQENEIKPKKKSKKETREIESSKSKYEGQKKRSIELNSKKQTNNKSHQDSVIKKRPSIIEILEEQERKGQKTLKIEEQIIKKKSPPLDKRSPKNQLLKIQKKKTSFLDHKEILVGPFTRLFGILFSLVLIISIYPYLNIGEFHNISQVLQKLLNDSLLNTIGFPINITYLKIITLLFVIDILSTLVFSTSIPLFLIGATTKGSFVSKRIKALIRLPLDMLSYILPLGDIPLLIGKKSFKETITLSPIIYRHQFLKYSSPFILCGLSLLIILNPILENSLKSFKFDNLKSNVPQYFSNKKSQSISQLQLGESFANNYYILGQSKQETSFTFINKKNARTYIYQLLDSIPFSDFKNKTKDIILFDQTYPHLSAYLKNIVDTHKMKNNINLRLDVGRIFDSGEAVSHTSINSLYNINFLAIGPTYDLFKMIGINYNEVTQLNRFNKLYFSQDTYYHMFIDKDSIKIFEIRSSKTPKKNELEQIRFKNHLVKGVKKTRDELYFSKESLTGEDSLKYMAKQDVTLDFVKRTGNKKAHILYKQYLRNIMGLVDRKNPQHVSVKASLKKLKFK